MFKRNLAENTETTINIKKAANDPNFFFQSFSFTHENKWKSNLLYELPEHAVLLV